MTAATVDRLAKSRESRQFAPLVAANTKLLAGTIVCISAAGFAVPGITSTTLTTMGVCQETVDNTGGADGALQAKVERGTWQFANSASTDQITAADWGKPCYLVDNQTVAKTNGGGTRSVAGTIRDVDASGVWVQF